MDQKTAIAIAKRYLSNIRKRHKVEDAILFGSFANKTNHPDSDIDLAIVFKSVDDIIDRQIELMCLREDDDLLIEPHAFLKRDFHVSNPIAAEIIKNGLQIS